jgi:hypothetical protein
MSAPNTSGTRVENYRVPAGALQDCADQFVCKLHQRWSQIQALS